MAENNEEFEKFKQMTSAEQMLESIEGKADPFAGYSLEELQSIADVINGFGDSKAKEAVVAMLKAEIDKQQSKQQPQEQEQPTPADSQEQRPADSDAPAQVDLKDLEFITDPSYSQYKAAEQIGQTIKASSNLPGATVPHHFEFLAKLDKLVENAQKVVDLAANEEITPENAVLLKDYINVLRDAKTFDVAEKEKMDALENKVDAQLKVFDKENGLDKLEGISAEELEGREGDWYNIANKLISPEDELSNVIKNLAIQELKVESDTPLYKEVIELAAEQTGKSSVEIRDIYAKGLNGKPLSDEENRLVATMEEIRKAMKEKIFKNKFEDLKEQFEATKAIERVKLSAEELYPDKKEMTPEELEQQRKKREQYLQEQITREGGLPNEEQWIEENSLRALRDKHSDEKISDEELLKKYSKEYSELKAAYTNITNEVSTATKTSYAIKVEQLACRSARITGAKEINKNTQEFLQDYAKNNKDSYKVGKMALSIGKSVAISQGLKYAFGFKGMAVYSAYKTRETINKSWNKYKENMQPGEKTSLLGFCSYLKENPKELTNVVSGVSKTVVMSTLAIAGTAMGIDNIPGVSAAIVGAINAATAVTKIHQNKEAIKNLWKNRDQIIQEFGEKHPKLKKYGKWGAVLLGTAALGYTAYKIFAPDEVKDAVEDATKDLANNHGNTGKPANLFEGQKFFKSVTDENENPRLGDSFEKQPINAELKGAGLGDGTIHVGAEAPKLDDVNAGISGDIADEAQATAEAYEMPQEEKDFLRKQVLGGPNSGPDPIIKKLKEMGVLSPSDEKVLIAAGNRTDGPKIASHALNAYLGLPADREVSVHANLTPEQQKELINFVHSKEYTEECTGMNEDHKEAIARRLAKVRGKINGDEGAGGGDGNSNSNGNGFHFENLENQNNAAPVQTEYTYNVSQRKKAIFNIVNKSMNPEQTSVDLSTKFSKEQLAQMSPEQIEKASMEMAAYQYIEQHGVKRAEIVDSNGNTHTYYRKDVLKDGDTVTKRVDRTADGQKITTKVTGTQNGATKVDYKGKIEQVTYADDQGNKVNIGGEGKDDIKRVVVDPTTGKEYTLVKGDDGKTYTLEKDMKTGKTTLNNGGSKQQFKKLYDAARQQR